MLDVLPLRMIVFQCLFLLIAIAIEAIILQRNLRITPQKSIEYATSINFLSVVVGWLIFLNVQIIIPNQLELKLVDWIFFDSWSQQTLVGIVLVALFTFFVSFFIKVIALKQLQIFLGDEEKIDPSEEKTLQNLKSRLKRHNFRGSSREATRQIGTVLLCNALSFSAISLIILLRVLSQINFGQRV